MKIKQIKVPSYSDFSKYKNEIHECLKRNCDKQIIMWLSDSPAQHIMIDCRNQYPFSFTYYNEAGKFHLADLYALIFFEKEFDKEVSGFEFYTYADHKIEIIADGVALTVTPIKYDVMHDDIWRHKILTKFIMSNRLMLHFTEQNEFVCNVIETPPEVIDFAKLLRPFSSIEEFTFVMRASLDDAEKDPNILTIVEQPLDSDYEYIVYHYNGDEFIVVDRIYRDLVKQGREQVYAKIKEVIDFLDKEVDDNVEPDACSIGIRAIEKLEKIIEEG